MDITENLINIISKNPRTKYYTENEQLIIDGSLDITEQDNIPHVSRVNADYVFIDNDNIKQIDHINCRVNMNIKSKNITRLNDITSHFILIGQGKLQEIKNIQANSIYINTQEKWESGKQKFILLDNITADFYLYLKSNNPEDTRYILNNANTTRLYVENPKDIILMDNTNIKEILYQDRDRYSLEEFVKTFNKKIYSSKKLWNENTRRYNFIEHKPTNNILNFMQKTR